MHSTKYSAGTSKLNKPNSNVKSYRFELSLKQNADSECPEFSYTELVKVKIKKQKLNHNQSNSIEETEDAIEKKDAESMARYFEKKYGVKKRRRDRLQDLADVGYGYDETDPFVDNSECYDELIPSSLTTQFGGFYINSGKLEFKQVSDESNPDDEDSLPLSTHLSKQKSSQFSTSDEEINEMKESKKFKKRKSSMEREEKRRKISLQGKDKLGRAKKKPTKVQLLIEKAKKAQHHLTDKLSTNKQQACKHHSEQNGVKERMKPTKSVSAHSEGRDGYRSSGSDDITLAQLSSSKEGSKLPQSIPLNIKEKISSLTKIAKSNEKEGKVKFFSPDVNHLLLGIEVGSQSLSNRERSGIYQHLTPHMPCSKDTLIRRMKKLRASNQNESLRSPLNDLKAAIGNVMEEQSKRYDEECAAQQLAKLDEKNPLAASTDEDDDGTTAPSGEEKTKRTYAPRRKFQWDEKLRSLLFDVIKVKLEQYETGKQSLSAEEFLKNFLEAEVKPLWPKGWMQSRVLYKEGKGAHHHVTGSQSKLKKAPPMVNRKQIVSKNEKKLPSSNTSIISTSSTDSWNKHNSKEASLSVNMKINCSATLENRSVKADLLNQAILNAQKEISIPKRSKPSSKISTDKTNYAKLSTSLLQSSSGSAKPYTGSSKHEDYLKELEMNKSTFKSGISVESTKVKGSNSAPKLPLTSKQSLQLHPHTKQVAQRNPLTKQIPQLNQPMSSITAQNTLPTSKQGHQHNSTSKQTSQHVSPAKPEHLLTISPKQGTQLFSSAQKRISQPSVIGTEASNKFLKRNVDARSDKSVTAVSKSLTKTPTSQPQHSFDVFSAELLKLALLSPPGSSPLLPQNMGFPGSTQTLEDWTNFMKLQQVTLQQPTPSASNNNFHNFVTSSQTVAKQPKSKPKIAQANTKPSPSPNRDKGIWRPTESNPSSYTKSSSDNFHTVSSSYTGSNLNVNSSTHHSNQLHNSAISIPTPSSHQPRTNLYQSSKTTASFPRLLSHPANQSRQTTSKSSSHQAKLNAQIPAEIVPSQYNIPLYPPSLLTHPPTHAMFATPSSHSLIQDGLKNSIGMMNSTIGSMSSGSMNDGAIDPLYSTYTKHQTGDKR